MSITKSICIEGIEDLALPPIWCPISSAINPNWKELDAQALAWADRFDLCSNPVQRLRLVGALAGDLAGRIMPRSETRQALQVATDYLMWLFVFDDAYCDEGIYRDRPNAMMDLALELARVVEMSGSDQDGRKRLPIVAALVDIRQRLENVASPVQVARWSAAVRAYLMCQAWEALNRANHVVPSLDQYAAAWRDS